MRFGLIGTGFWARETHAAALAAADGVELAGVWGRDPGKAAALAEHAGTTAYDDVDTLIAAVDAVAFSVPPDVQAELAERAARAGRHLLLEKPVALTAAAAATLTDAVERAGVASVVFFTTRYTPEGRQWLAGLAGQSWEGATGHWLANAFGEGSPFATPWRRQHGGLWDVGPHAVSLVSAALGPVTAVRAVAGVRDLVHLALRHEGGATSTLALSLTTPPAATRVGLEVWGPAGRTQLPERVTSAADAARVAVEELCAAAAASRPSHPCDVHFGRYVVEVLEAAQRQLTAG